MGRGMDINRYANYKLGRLLLVIQAKVCYKQIKPPFVGEHAFPLMGFVCEMAHVTQRLFFHESSL